MINPSFFYWLMFFEKVNCILCVLIFLSCIATGVMLVIKLIQLAEAYDDDEREEVREKFNKPLKISAIILAVSVFLFIFIPNEESIIGMAVADNATPENIQILMNCKLLNALKQRCLSLQKQKQ